MPAVERQPILAAVTLAAAPDSFLPSIVLMPAYLMPGVPQRTFSWCILAAAVVAATVWALQGTTLPPADFSFVNGTEVKSLDPAIVTGQPGGRIINALYEGLIRWHPQTLEPIPGVAESWEQSEDKTAYTFRLRQDARWSDGTPVTASDFCYSFRRFLGPRTVAEYAYVAWDIKNARRYSLGGDGIEPGDLVEIELNLAPEAINTLRGELLHGKLIDSADHAEDQRVFTVEVDGRPIKFYPTDDDVAAGPPPSDGRWCRQVLLDFREVGVEEIDPHTLRITLENPTAYFLKLLGFYPLSPVNRKCLETHGSPGWTKADHLIGNGAFQIEFRRIRDRIRLVRSDTYWNRKQVRLAIVDALAVESRTTAVNLFMTDAVDWVEQVPSPILRILLQQKPPRTDLNPAPFLAAYFYMLNTTRKPLDDVRVRRALSLALDRGEIVATCLAAGETPCLNLVPPGMVGYEPQEAEAENADKARQLLADAGYPDGKGFPRFDILYNNDETHQSIAELIRKQWQRELGISVRTRNEEWASYLTSQRQMQYDIARRAWIGDYTDPNTFLDMYLTNGEQNNTGYSNPRYDQLIAEARREVDPQQRLRQLEEAERMLMDDLPIIPIYFYSSRNMVKPHVRGFYNNLQDMHPLWNIWIDRESDGPNEFIGESR